MSILGKSPVRFIRISALLAVSLVPLAGCQEAADGPGGAEGSPFLLDLRVSDAEELFSIGVVDGGPQALSFGRIAGVAFGEAGETGETGETGELLVLDALAREVRRFDSTGNFLGRFGGSGEGPGEFSAPIWLDAFEERIAVLDRGGRITIFSSAGEPLEERSLSSLSLARILLLPGGPSGRDLAAVTAASASVREVSPGIAVGVVRDHDVFDTIAVGSSGDMLFHSGVGSFAITTPVCSSVHAAVASSGDLFVADGASGVLERLPWPGDGEVDREEWRIAQVAPPISSVRLRELQERIPDGVDPADGELVTPEIESRICDLRAGSDGAVWIRFQDEGEGELWGQFGPSEGPAAGLVRFAPAAKVVAFSGTRAAAVVQDELGVQTLRIYRLPTLR